MFLPKLEIQASSPEKDLHGGGVTTCPEPQKNQLQKLFRKKTILHPLQIVYIKGKTLPKTHTQNGTAGTQAIVGRGLFHLADYSGPL